MCVKNLLEGNERKQRHLQNSFPPLSLQLQVTSVTDTLSKFEASHLPELLVNICFKCWGFFWLHNQLYVAEKYPRNLFV